MPLPFRIFLMFLMLALFNPVFGQKTFTQRAIGFQNDNDVYLMTRQDQYYTNGINLSYRKAVDSTRLSARFENKVWAVGFGQKIFNASDGAVLSFEDVDRPITGYLYAKGEINWFTKGEEVFSLGTEVAAIGPWALGRDMQEGFHRTFGFYDIYGWEYQLNNSIGVDVFGSYSSLFFRNQRESLDVIMTSNISLGMNNTRLSTGPTFRWGHMNRLYESVALASKVQSKNRLAKSEFYFFYRPELNWVIYNSTIQGGLFLRDKGPITFDLKPIMVSHQVGFQYSINRIGVNMRYIFNSKEVRSEATAHQYGTIALAYYF